MAYRGLGCLLVLLLACSSSDDGPIAAEAVVDEDVLEEVAEQEVPTVELSTESANIVVETGGEVADVTAVSVAGNAGDYQLSVTVSSPDTGCGQYADWWEVLDEAGDLLYRRVLLHSHVSEQPFKRSGGPVAVAVDQVVCVRAHMHPQGYGGVAFKGSVQDDFAAVALGADFAAALATRDPLPEDCDF